MPSFIVVVVFTGLRTGKYDRIKRWWSSNIGQGFLQSYTLLLVITNYSSPALPTCLSRFSGLFYFPPPSYRPPIISIRRCCTSLSVHPLPNSSPSMVCRPPGLLPYLPPASLRCSSLEPAPHACICHCFLRPFAPHFLPYSCTQVPVGPWGFARRGSLHIPCVPPPYVCAVPLPRIFWVLVSLLGVHFLRGRGGRAPPLPGSRSPQTPPPPLSLPPL